MPLTLGVPLGYTVPLGVNSQILSRRLSGIPVLTPGEYPRSPPRGSLRVAHQQWCASLRTRLHRSQDYPKKFPKHSKKVSKTSLLRRIFGAYNLFGLSRIPELAAHGFRPVLVNNYVALIVIKEETVYVAHVFHQTQDYANLV